MADASTIVLHDIPAIVHQDDFSPAKGNALQACIASLFHLPLESVPNFIALDCGYEQGIRDFLGSSYSVTKLPCNIEQHPCKCKGRLCVLRGKSPRGDFGHVVLAIIREEGSFEMVHDPHPDSSFLDTKKEAYGWFMIFDRNE
jgi:hypothetical protein